MKGFLLTLMAVGSVVLWVGIPAGCLWVASKLTESGAQHFLVALPMTLAAMGLFAAFLAWMNRLYLRIALSAGHESDPPWRLRGPLEPLLVNSLGIAIVVMFIWFFVFAENPPSCAGN